MPEICCAAPHWRLNMTLDEAGMAPETPPEQHRRRYLRQRLHDGAHRPEDAQ